MAKSASAPSERFRVGYALAEKKQQSFIQPSLVALAASRGVDIVPVDPSVPISDQGPFHCLIHKLYTDDWKSNLRRFSLSHPDVPIIDPPDAIERLHNRISMLQVVSELQIPLQHETFGIPKQVVVYDLESLASLADSAVASLRFPVIAKPLVADGSAKSHKMALVYHLDGLSKLKPPIVLQEFVNHGGVIFKVYVVGDYVKCVKRKSLPDISKEKLESSEASLPFSQVSNMTPTVQDRTEKEYYETMHLEEAEMPPAGFVAEIARGLRQAMRLQLFNFDMIRDTEAVNHYLVVDINYFPGYAKMPDYETVLSDFFWNLVHKKKEDTGLSSAIDGSGEKREPLGGNHDDK